jgi:hypothetical protein
MTETVWLTASPVHVLGREKHWTTANVFTRAIHCDSAHSAKFTNERYRSLSDIIDHRNDNRCQPCSRWQRPWSPTSVVN